MLVCQTHSVAPETNQPGIFRCVRCGKSFEETPDLRAPVKEWMRDGNTLTETVAELERRVRRLEESHE